MSSNLFATTHAPVEDFVLLKRLVPVALLAVYWCWESWLPYFDWRGGRLNHAAHNLAIALVNTASLGLLFGGATLAVADRTGRNRLGLPHVFGADEPMRFALALILLDAWMYAWHRANHAIP